MCCQITGNAACQNGTGGVSGTGGAGGTGGAMPQASCTYLTAATDAVRIIDGTLHVVGDVNGEGFINAQEPFTVSWTYGNLGAVRSKSSDDLMIMPKLLVMDLSGTTQDQTFAFSISGLDPCAKEMRMQRFASGLPAGSFVFSLANYPPFSGVVTSKAIGLFSGSGGEGGDGTGGAGGGP